MDGGTDRTLDNGCCLEGEISVLVPATIWYLLNSSRLRRAKLFN